MANIDLGALDETNGFRFDGAAAGDGSGSSTSGAGDVNGDGFDDVIVGAGRADPSGRIRAGSSYVVFGRADGFDAALNLGTLNGTNGFRLDGAARMNFSGRSVSSAGDVNGDETVENLGVMPPDGRGGVRASRRRRDPWRTCRS